MTLNNAAWAIDGATLNSALARTEAYAANSGSEGIIAKSDLKVQALATPGNGVTIAAGAALVLNRYQSTPNQMYTVLNSGSHIVSSAEMPPSSASQQTYIVGIAIGDPEFSQSGHPFMAATDPPAGEGATFKYVRPIVVLESSFNARAYPAIPLARLVVPANTTTIQNSMLTDLRKMSRPRTKLEIAHVPGPATSNSLNGAGGVAGALERWPNIGVLQVEIPSWAVKAKVIGFIEGAKLTKSGLAVVRGYIEGTSLATSSTNLNDGPATGSDRRHFGFAGEIALTDEVRGTIRTFSVQGAPNNDASKGAYVADSVTSVAIQVYFEEQPT